MALLFWRQPCPAPCPLWSARPRREAEPKQAVAAVCPVCSRTAVSCPAPAVGSVFLSIFNLSRLVNERFLRKLITYLLAATASPAAALSEPSCDVISKAQKLQDEAERSWALSQACAYYQHRCPAGELDKESCIRIMGESCSARVLQCSLLNTMQNLEPATQTHVEGEEMFLTLVFECGGIIFTHLLTISVSVSKQQYAVRGCPPCRMSPSLAPGLWAALLLLRAAGPGWSTCS